MDFVVHSEVFWDALVSIAGLRVVYFHWVGFADHKHRQRQVNESISIVACLLQSLGQFENLRCNRTCNHGRACCYCRDDLTCYHFCLVLRAFLDLIISSSQVRTSMNESNVEICRIILFKNGGLY
jgi:hypothetical protein